MTFYFYDLETTGVDSRNGRVMQFAGQRTDMNLKPVGEPHDILIKLTDEILPEPDAVMITGITPQQTIQDGITEAEFLKLFHEEIATPDTIFTGFNTIRFDDEFMRFMLYRNFYDAYEWQWKDGRSRWDILDVARMTRALRPEGIEWPFDSNGKPSNRLELLTAVNKLSHENAHDALSDVTATIAVAQLIKEKQPKLFAYLLALRDKKEAKKVTDEASLFVYTSGKYATESQKTTIATKLAETTEGAALVYDLSVDPAPFIAMDELEIEKTWKKKYKDPDPKLPVKSLKFNRCPALAPLGVLQGEAESRLGLSIDSAKKFAAQLHASDFAEKCLRVQQKMDDDRNRAQSKLLDDKQDVDARLYEGFVSGSDKTQMNRVRNAKPTELKEIQSSDFNDERLQGLLPLYKARNFASQMNDEERAIWETFRKQRLMAGGQTSRMARYMKRLQELDATVTDKAKQYLLEELQLYAESIFPEE